MTRSADQEVGFGKPPKSTQFRKGASGNPRGRPRGKKSDIPYDHLLGQMVTIREDGRERRVTAAEAFLLQLTKKGLEGCNTSARASLASIEHARESRQGLVPENMVFRIIFRAFGLGCIIEDLGMGVRVNPTSKEKVRLELKPWVVQLAVNKMPPRHLDEQQQAVVVAATQTPIKVNWPNWWTIRS